MRSSHISRVRSVLTDPPMLGWVKATAGIPAFLYVSV